jgi:hypothetical protein
LDRGWNLLLTIVMITNLIQTIIMITNVIETIIMKRKKIIPKSLFDSSDLYFITSRVCICIVPYVFKMWNKKIGGYLYFFTTSIWFVLRVKTI